MKAPINCVIVHESYICFCCRKYHVSRKLHHWDHNMLVFFSLFLNLYVFSPCIVFIVSNEYTVYPKKYAHGFCFAVLCCVYTLTDLPISIRLTSLALWQSNDCPSASKAILMNMDKYFIWIHYERFQNHNKAKHNETVCIFLGIYCTYYHTSRGFGQHTGVTHHVSYIWQTM